MQCMRARIAPQVIKVRLPVRGGCADQIDCRIDGRLYELRYDTVSKGRAGPAGFPDRDDTTARYLHVRQLHGAACRSFPTRH